MKFSKLRRLFMSAPAVLLAVSVHAQPGPPQCTGPHPQTWNMCLGTVYERGGEYFYTGEFRNGLPGGLGFQRTANGLYAGEFLQGRMHGQGVLTLPDRTRYAGSFRAGLMHGEGAMYGADGKLTRRVRHEDGVLRGTDAALAAAPESSAAPGLAVAVLPAPLPIPAAAPQAPADSAPAAPARQAVAAVTPAPGFVSGRVTMPDGSRLPGDVKDVTVSIHGISLAGEKVSYSPEVRPDGQYRQRVAPGQYRFGTSTLTARLGDRQFRINLEPVGDSWSRNRDPASGIVQDFVWKVSGLTVLGRGASAPKDDNPGHWNGQHVSLSWQVWRHDLRKSTSMPPAGTRLRLTVRPTSATIDGRTLSPFLLERDWSPQSATPVRDLNDLPPADLEITGVAVLPDGSTRPLLFQGRGDYPNFRSVLKVPLTPSGSSVTAYENLNAGWVVE